MLIGLTYVKYELNMCGIFVGVDDTSLDATTQSTTKDKLHVYWFFTSADIMASLCGFHVHVCIRVNNFSKTTRPRDMLF